jgi:tetratricopeptide (TPR) repeat protein
LAIPNGRVIRLTFSKDKLFRPGNDKVLIEIRVAGEGSDHQWINYDLSGNVVGNENAVKSGIRVVRPISRRDEADCTSPSEPATIVAACTHLIESGQFAGHDLAVFHYNRGVAHKAKNDIDQALNDYSEAIRLDPNYARAYLNRGAVLVDKREIDRAIADFTEAIRLDPKKKLGYINRAVVYKTKRDWDHAIADYGEAIRLDPSDIYILYGRGDAYLSKQDYDRAIGDFTEVIRLEPKAAGAFTFRGRGHRAKGESERAIADFTEAIRLAPHDPAPYIDRATSYRYAGDLDRAIAGYTEALGIDPRNARTLFARGFTAFLAGSPAKALADISQANALDPAEPYAALWLGILGQRSGLANPMAKATAKVDMTAWPAPVIKLFLGELMVEALRAAADHPDPKTRGEQVCEANFYTGEIARRSGAKAEAARLFTLAAQECPATWIELEAANAELKALAASR